MLKSTIKSAFKSIALAITIIFGATIAPEAHNHFLRWKVGESVVQVLHPLEDGHGGTGFAIKGKSGADYIMTNRHVCEAKVNGIIRIKTNSKLYFRKVIYQDSVHDLCLIRGVKELSPLSLGSDLKKGDFLYVVGHPGLRQLTTSTGEYIGRKSIELQVPAKTRQDCPGRVIDLPPLYQLFSGADFVCVRSFDSLATSAVTYGGNSGSPVVNRYGNLIGVVFAGSTEQERDNYLVPLRYVKAVLNKF